MIGNVAGICESDGQLGPGFIAQVELGRKDLVVKNAPLTTTEMSMKIIGHHAVNEAGTHAHSPVAELQDGSCGGGVFVTAEDFIGRLRIVCRHFLDL